MIAKSLAALATAAILAVSATAVFARGGHGGYRLRGPAAPAYFIVDIDEIVSADDLETALQKIPGTLAPFGGRVILDSSSMTALDGPGSARFFIVEFDSLDKAKEWDVSNDGKEFESVRHRATKSRELLATGRPLEPRAAFGGRNSAARQEMMKIRDQEIKSLKNICRGC